MNCLIVDDELLAQDVLALYISKVDFLNLTGRCNNALQAFAALNREPVDLLFLDIKMPEMTGLDFLRNIRNPPKVILTTAYDEFALDGYELDVADYLLKPIRFERFLKAVQKVQALRQPDTVSKDPDELFYVRSDRRLIQINSREVRYVESLKNYLSIHMGVQPVTIHGTLASIEAELKANPYFVQIHKSFIVNTRFIAEVGTGTVRLKNNVELPIGGFYKDSLLQAIRIFNPG
jgi:DNA-binding LytR/AlgR family response regulator